jgi:hypothetical protein
VCCRVGWNCAAACTAAVVGPVGALPALVVIVRGAEDALGDMDADVDCWREVLCVYDDGVLVPVTPGEVVAAFCIAECARNAAKKFERNGRFVDIVNGCVTGFADDGKAR